MKKQGLLFLNIFTAALILILGACSDKDDTQPNQNQKNDSPTLETKTVVVPDAMMQSSDPGAQMAVSYINMANSFTGFAGIMTPPGGSGPYKSTMGGDPWIHTWDVVDGTDAFTVTLTVIETETHYEWTMIINGTIDGIILTDFLYIEAIQTLDGKTGEFYYYDINSGVLGMSVVWSTDSNGIYNVTWEAPNETKIEMTNYPDGSGEISVYEWYEIEYMLTFNAEWNSAGQGEWWEYENGEIIDHGIF